MNNYLNNTLTNLHLQDFLKEKGLDVSHMRYISDRQLAVDNLHMVPNLDTLYWMVSQKQFYPVKKLRK